MKSQIIKKYHERVAKVQSLLCVGLDSAFGRLPERFKESNTPQFAFNRWIIDETHHTVCAYKPNIAFYEARGAAGWRELQLTMNYLQAHHPDILTICDAKRGDIDSTNAGYVQAIFDSLGFDAITLNPYLGAEALAPFLAREDKACIILCRTSNLGAGEFQDLSIEGVPLWAVVAQRVATEWHQQNHNCMLVVGATYPDELKRVREIAPDIPLLIPGIGVQGGDLERTLEVGLDANQQGLIISASRSVIFGESPRQVAEYLNDEINLHRGITL